MALDQIRNCQLRYNNKYFRIILTMFGIIVRLVNLNQVIRVRIKQP